jgi:hypothetical protein
VFFISRRLHAPELLLIYLVFTVSDHSRRRLVVITMHLRLALRLCVTLLYLIAQISSAAAQVGS